MQRLTLAVWGVGSFLLLSVFGCSSDSGAGSDLVDDRQSRSSESCESPNVGPECTVDLCKKNDCGAATSIFDENGCYRKSCQNDKDCGSQEQCVEVEYAPVSCSGADPETGECSCGWLTVARTSLFCMPRPVDQVTPGGVACESPNVGPECTVDLCKKNDCGAATSIFDENGCYRKSCQNDKDCGSQEQCVEVDYAPVSCSGADPETGECICGWLGVARTSLFCMPLS
ncbi:MAG TPA: hypothetical protein PKL73_24730 [Polyangiaceae bacterium]|jgi:hypothetical protein|nr:MAG: hypothetical protein BWY17_05255 [Deltaproteobacteria bacterium ADurb.Bin207]HNT00190.1 hypothetical protein [Polyangiaceae bacterium]HNZ25560.1 hypothetical protein [Polyangiaceae bacterium]HOD25684.1 hypothetical protein [Polyangiaceae bacterium]HOH03812.1 hypothetical protein [Polyangiaceae bacterium]